MFVSLIFILLLTISGLSLTYLFAEDEPLLWRFAAANVVGSTIFGLVCFLAACFFGFAQTTILLSLFASLLPLILFGKKDLQARFSNDLQTARKNLEGTDLNKFLSFAYYIFFFVLFWLFFERAILEKPDGIFTGASQNLGDLPFHLGAIFSFTEGQNFPPENPSFAFAKFTYPFIADLITASFVKFGVGVREAVLWQNIFFGFSLVVLLERFVFKLTGSHLAGKLAPALLFFSGGLGFLWFLNDFWQSGKDFFDFLGNLQGDYTIGENFRWGNSLVVLFITQRSLLLGMPLTLIVLQKLWEIFTTETERRREEINRDGQDEKSLSTHHSPLTTFIVGLLAGTLPLVHVHSLVVLFVVSAFLFFFSLNKSREWIAFALGVALIAVPELVWAMTGSATHLTEFVDWHFGWDKKNENFLAFWLKNLGLFIPLLLLGIFLTQRYKGVEEEKRDNEPQKSTDKHRLETQRTKDKKQVSSKEAYSPLTAHHLPLLLFYIPFAFLFVVSNAVKLAPWEWDNIKVLIYWFVVSIPFVALALAWLWQKNLVLKIVAAACFTVLTFAGALDVWRTVSAQINYKVFDKDAVKIAEQIKQKTARNALFLNAPTYNSAVVLSGRRSLMRYVGHLSSYGIDYEERETDLKRIYAGDATARIFLDKYQIEYVLISPEETSSLAVNKEFFEKFPVVAEAGQYKVYKIK
jgi:hypothetical protein